MVSMESFKLSHYQQYLEYEQELYKNMLFYINLPDDIKTYLTKFVDVFPINQLE